MVKEEKIKEEKPTKPKHAFKAKFEKGKLKILPNIDKDNKGNVTVHALSPQAEAKAKHEILQKLAAGESVEDYLLE